MTRSAAAILIAALSVGSLLLADRSLMTLGEILVFRLLDTGPGANGTALEAAFASLSEEGASTELYLLRADRGALKGRYAVVGAGSTASVPELRERSEQAMARLAPLAKGEAQSFEYRLLSPDTVGALPSVDVLGMHYHQVPEQRREGFERFVREKIHPAVAGLRPDLRLLYYRAVEPADAGRYVTVFALTRESRDRYWPGGTDSDDLRAAFAPVRGLTKELSTYLVEGSYLADEKFAAAVYESRDWTDFVLVSSP